MGLGRNQVRELFRTEPGVLHSAPLRRLRPRKGQDTACRDTLRIPESVLLRVHARLAAWAGEGGPKCNVAVACFNKSCVPETKGA